MVSLVVSFVVCHLAVDEYQPGLKCPKIGVAFWGYYVCLEGLGSDRLMSLCTYPFFLKNFITFIGVTPTCSFCGVSSRVARFSGASKSTKMKLPGLELGHYRSVLTRKKIKLQLQENERNQPVNSSGPALTKDCSHSLCLLGFRINY